MRSRSRSTSPSGSSNVVPRMNADSDNFVAEMVLKGLGATVAEPGSTAAGARVVRSTLRGAGVRLAGVRIADGSGLSRFDRVTVSALADILRAGASRRTCQGRSSSPRWRSRASRAR